jgi:KaiC/GvpD/RAD55 family RecA-like ATPase
VEPQLPGTRWFGVTSPHEASAYTFGTAVPDAPLDSIPAGTNLLVVGDEESGAADLVYRVLAQAPAVGEKVILVTTDETTGSLAEAYRSILPDATALDHLFVVDASMSGLDRDTGPLSPTHVEAAASPTDITGIGVGVTNHLRTLRTDRVRLGLLSLSPLLDALGAERTFAFFHVLTSRVRQNGHLGLFTIDPSHHEQEHVDILQSLTDGAFRFETTDATSLFRGVGAVDAVSEWTPLE